jgi:hypothetical protein
MTATEMHHAVRDALEDNLTSRDFVIGVIARPLTSRSRVLDVGKIAQDIDAWLATLDPDTRDASCLSTEVRTSTVAVKVHAIPKAPPECTRRARPIVWNDKPLELVASNDERARVPDVLPSAG